MKFYLLSLKWSRGNFLTWWRPNSAGYCWDLDSAGLYEEAEAKQIEEAGHRSSVAIPQDVAERYTSRVVEDCHLEKLGITRDEWRKAQRS